MTRRNKYFQWERVLDSSKYRERQEQTFPVEIFTRGHKAPRKAKEAASLVEISVKRIDAEGMRDWVQPPGHAHLVSAAEANPEVPQFQLPGPR